MPRQSKGSRKRTGCVKCKERHIQCSEELPRCKRCERLNFECVRGLQLIFREDAIQRGITFGREGVWSKRPGPTAHNRTIEAAFQGVPLTQYANRWIFLNLNESNFQDTDHVSRKHCALQPRCRSITFSGHRSIPISIYHPFHSVPETERYLLDYFIRDIGPSCSLSELHNPYISLVVPLCFVSGSFRPALLAVAANQLCLLGNDQFIEQAYYYKHMALKGIRQEIAHGVHDDGTIASILMLCFHDISDECSTSWLMHLRGGLQILDGSTCQSSPDLWKFFTLYFVAHDIMSRTTSENWIGDKKSQIWFESEDLEEFDMLMGCSRGLMILINQITIHASTKTKILKYRSLNPNEIQRYAKVSSEIGGALLSMKQKLPENSIGRKDLKRIALIKHLAALLYLTERLGYFQTKCENGSTRCSAPPEAMIQENECLEVWISTAEERNSGAGRYPTGGWRSCEQPPSYCRLREVESDIGEQKSIGVYVGCKSHLMSWMIELMSTLPDVHTLLWPLFVLGNASLESEEQRRFVLDRLANIQRTQNLGSVRRTIDAVKHAFMTKSLLAPGDRVWGHKSFGYISLA